MHVYGKKAVLVLFDSEVCTSSFKRAALNTGRGHVISIPIRLATVQNFESC